MGQNSSRNLLCPNSGNVFVISIWALFLTKMKIFVELFRKKVASMRSNQVSIKKSLKVTTWHFLYRCNLYKSSATSIPLRLLCFKLQSQVASMLTNLCFIQFFNSYFQVQIVEKRPCWSYLWFFSCLSVGSWARVETRKPLMGFYWLLSSVKQLLIIFHLHYLKLFLLAAGFVASSSIWIIFCCDRRKRPNSIEEASEEYDF